MKLSVTKQQIQFFFQNVTRSLGRPQGENVHRIQLTKTSGANRGDTLLMKTTYLIRSDKKARAKDPDQPAEVAADRPAETRTHAIRLNRKFQGVDGEERVLRAGEDSSGPGGDKESADGSAASSQPAMEAGGDRESADGSAASSQPAKEAGGDRESADGSEVGQDYGTKKRGAKPGGTLTSTGPDNITETMEPIKTIKHSALKALKTGKGTITSYAATKTTASMQQTTSPGKTTPSGPPTPSESSTPMLWTPLTVINRASSGGNETSSLVTLVGPSQPTADQSHVILSHPIRSNPNRRSIAKNGPKSFTMSSSTEGTSDGSPTVDPNAASAKSSSAVTMAAPNAVSTVAADAAAAAASSAVVMAELNAVSATTTNSTFPVVSTAVPNLVSTEISSAAPPILSTAASNTAAIAAMSMTPSKRRTRNKNRKLFRFVQLNKDIGRKG